MGTTEPLALARQVSGALDALVRAAFANPPSVDALADRLVAVWLAAGGLALELSPTTLSSQGVVYLRADAGRGRWLLPAFMAGMHSIALAKDGSHALGLISLAHELAALRMDAKALEQFSAWVWGEGAEGLTIGVDAGILEVGSVRERSEGSSQSDQLRAVRSASMVGEEVTAMDGADLDRAALREELAAPLALYETGVTHRAFELPESERRSLGRAVDDPIAWLEIELSVALNGPAILVERLPVSRIVRGIIGRIKSGTTTDARLVERLYGIRGKRPDVWRGLVDGGVGSALGANISLIDPLLLALVQDKEIGGDLARALLARATDDESRRAVGRLGVRQLLACGVLAPEVTVETAAQIVAITLAVEPELLRFVLARVPHRLGIAPVAELPQPHVSAARELISRALLQRPVEDAVVALIKRSEDRALIADLAKRMRRRLGADFLPSAVKSAAAVLAADPQGALLVAALSSHPCAKREVKLALLQALDHQGTQAACELAQSSFWIRFDDRDVRRARLRLGRHSATRARAP